MDECQYESCFDNSLVNGAMCYSFGICRNTLGSFVCECFDGFEYDAATARCVDIDECAVLEQRLQLTDTCYKDAFHMTTCTNLCGNYSCQCKNTTTTIVDAYDASKCYLR